MEKLKPKTKRTPIPTNLLTVVQVAAREGTTEAGIRDQIKRKVLPHVKRGHRILVPEEALDRLNELKTAWGVTAEEAFQNIQNRKAAKRVAM